MDTAYTAEGPWRTNVRPSFCITLPCSRWSDCSTLPVAFQPIQHELTVTLQCLFGTKHTHFDHIVFLLYSTQQFLLHSMLFSLGLHSLKIWRMRCCTAKTSAGCFRTVGSCAKFAHLKQSFLQTKLEVANAPSPQICSFRWAKERSFVYGCTSFKTHQKCS